MPDQSGRVPSCQEWADEGRESQETCPSCGHYALFHGVMLPGCRACSDDQGQRIADAVRAEGRTPSPDPEQHPGYCFPSMDDTCGNCHRCTPAAEGRVPSPDEAADELCAVLTSMESVGTQHDDAVIVSRSHYERWQRQIGRALLTLDDYSEEPTP